MLKVIVLSRFLCKIVKYLNDGLPYKFYCFFWRFPINQLIKKFWPKSDLFYPDVLNYLSLRNAPLTVSLIVKPDTISWRNL